MNKKAQTLGLAQAPGLVITFGILIIVTAIVALVNSNIGSTFTSGTIEENVTTYGSQGLLNFAIFNPTIGTVMAAVILLSLVIVGIGGFIVFSKDQ